MLNAKKTVHNELQEAIKQMECIQKHCSARDLNASLGILTKLTLGETLSSADMKDWKRMCTDEKEIRCQLTKCPLTKTQEAKQEGSVDQLERSLPKTKQSKEIVYWMRKELSLRAKIKKSLRLKKASRKSRSKSSRRKSISSRHKSRFKSSRHKSRFKSSKHR